jgi:EthD domain
VGALMLIFTSLLRRLPQLSHEEFVNYHLQVHAPLFVSTPEARKYLRRYTIDHPRPTYAPGLRPPDYDAVVRMWFDNRFDLVKMFSSRSYWSRIRPDEKRFFDHKASEFYMATEQIVLEGTAITLPDGAVPYGHETPEPSEWGQRP